MNGMTGLQFGRWTVLSFAYARPWGNYWYCQCACGTVRAVFAGSLRIGKTHSCGCLQRELAHKRRLKHGGSHTRLWNIRMGMIRRCENRNSNRYRSYGARGIRVCTEWREDFAAFRDWALSHGYTDCLTIDRINNDGNYEPGNCRWLSLSENSRKKHLRPLVSAAGGSD